MHKKQRASWTPLDHADANPREPKKKILVYSLEGVHLQWLKFTVAASFVVC